MSERHRHTQRASRRMREDARTTLRAPRIMQVGGSHLYRIPDSRIEKWNAAFESHPDIFIKSLKGKLNQENWGQPDANSIVELYAKLIERQDDLALIAISIIYSELHIDSNAANLEVEVTTKIADAKLSDNGEALKEYLLDIFRIITGKDAIKSVTDKTQIVMKHTRLYSDPLSNILMWPKRATNMFVHCIAKILMDLKQDSTNLTRSKGNPDSYRMFADIYDTYIHREVLYNTSKNLRDGFYIWQKLYISIIPLDECALESASYCEKTYRSQSLWEEFCNHYNTESTTLFPTTAGKVKTLAENNVKIRFSRILAGILKIFMSVDNASTLRNQIIARFTTYEGQPSTSGSGTIYRINAIANADSGIAKMMRALDPEQYTFILHLLYTMDRLEKEDAATPASSSSSD